MDAVNMDVQTKVDLSQTPRRIGGLQLRKKLKLVNEDPAVYACVSNILSQESLVPTYVEFKDKNKVFAEVKWDEIPYSCTPRGGFLPEKRVLRKTQQVDNMLVPLLKLIDHARRRQQKIKIVEFCAGSGFVILPLAALVMNSTDSEYFSDSDFEFIIVDFKPKSIELAKERVASAGLSSIVKCITGRIEDFNEPFDVGIALHACGAGTYKGVRVGVRLCLCVFMCL